MDAVGTAGCGFWNSQLDVGKLQLMGRESSVHTVQLTANTDQTKPSASNHSRFPKMGWALPKEGQGNRILKYSGLELNILRSPFSSSGKFNSTRKNTLAIMAS